MKYILLLIFNSFSLFVTAQIIFEYDVNGNLIKKQFENDLSFGLEMTICEGEEYEGYNKTGIYSDTYTSEKGCDSIRILDLKVLPIIEDFINETICEGDTYEGYSESGNYIDVFPASNGCDSIRVLNLVVTQITENIIESTICEGEEYEGYSQTGNYSDTFNSSDGCDSIRILNLIVNPVLETLVEETICSGEEYEGYSQTGNYSDTFNSSDGCDSIRVLNLVVTQITENIIESTICEGEEYEGYSQTGNYSDTFNSSDGCDSIRILNLIVNPVLETLVEETICSGEEYEGYTESGSYSDTFTSSDGCDSIRIINLSVTNLEVEYEVFVDSLSSVNVTVMGGTPPYLYSWNDPNNQTSNPALNLSAGVYSVTITDNNQCQSIISVIVSTTSIVNLENSHIKIFPNPTSDILNVSVEKPMNYQYRFFDVNGRIVKSGKLNYPDNKIDVYGLKGIYLFEVSSKRDVVGIYKVIAL